MNPATSYRWIAPVYDFVVAAPLAAARRASLTEIPAAGSLDILLSGFTGEGAKTVIPAVAMAKVSMRLVPNQDPDRIAELFEAYVKKVAPKTVELKVTRMHGGKPWMTEFDNPFVQAAGRAIEKGFGKAPVFNREGGSIPVVATFQEILGLPSVLFGVGLPDENAHAPNEFFSLETFRIAREACARYWDEAATAMGAG